MKIKSFAKKIIFYLGLLVFVVILKINHLIGFLGGVLYIFVWHFIFNKNRKEMLDCKSPYDLPQTQSTKIKKSLKNLCSGEFF